MGEPMLRSTTTFLPLAWKASETRVIMESSVAFSLKSPSRVFLSAPSVEPREMTMTATSAPSAHFSAYASVTSTSLDSSKGECSSQPRKGLL